MNPVLRLCLLFLLAALCALPAGWLLLVCVELAGFDSCLAPRAGWVMLAALCAPAITLPPILHAWPDEERPFSELARESLRAALFCFTLGALAFLAGLRPLAQFLGLPDLMMSSAAAALSPVIASILACLSVAIGRKLLPRPAPEDREPLSMRWFGWLSLALILLLVFQPWLIGVRTSLFAARMAYPATIWLLLALRYLLIIHGDAGMMPVWGTMSLLLGFRVGTILPEADTATLTFCAALLLLAASSCFCLLQRESRRWLC